MITFNTRELDALAAGFARLGATAPPMVATATKATVFGIEADGRALAPVDTGYLRGSISSEFQGGAAAFVGITGPTANYGRYVEEGTSRMGGQPYMTPAAERRMPSYLAAIESIIGRQP